MWIRRWKGLCLGKRKLLCPSNKSSVIFFSRKFIHRNIDIPDRKRIEIHLTSISSLFQKQTQRALFGCPFHY